MMLHKSTALDCFRAGGDFKMRISPRRDFEGLDQAQLTALAEAWLS
jgi:hypothetical protein